MKMIFKLGDAMERKEDYHTKQKEILLNIIKKENGRFTVNDIYEKTNGVGLTTVYRFINSLVDDGRLKKEVDNNNQVYYYYLSECDCDHHFYLKCNKCGMMIHVDCEFTNEIYNHILKDHSFVIDKKNLIINGICDKCREAK